MLFIPQRIAVIGSGAVGCYYGGQLARHGLDVQFHMRRDLEHVKRHGLTIRSCHGDFDLPHVHAFGRTEEMGTADLVLITLKATANSSLDALIPPLLGPQTLLLTLQNGLGNEEYLAERWGASRVLGGVCFTCINRTAPGCIEHTAQGQIAIAGHSPENAAAATGIAALFNRNGVECELAPSIPAVRWRKLVWNIPFNGLAILGGGIDTAHILANPDLRALTRALMVEVMECSAALGYPLPDWLPEDQFERTETMRAYRPSSMIDFVEGREVEVEAIWGEPVRRALAAGVNAGRIESLYRLISDAVARRKT